MMPKDKLNKTEVEHKIHQLQKRINRSLTHKGHTSKLKMIKRLKRLAELKKTLYRYV